MSWVRKSPNALMSIFTAHRITRWWDGKCEMKPVAVVIPWFGRELKGGAEQYAWQIAVRLRARGHPVEVLTTCCRAFLEDWSTNHFPAGVTEEDGVTVRRFP